MQSKAEQRPGAGGPCDTRAYEDNARGRPDVTGIALQCYREPSGDSSMPFDFSKAPLEVYQLAGDTWEPAKAVYGHDGQFTLEVPVGRTYAIHLRGHPWHIGNARWIDLSSYQTGRPDAVPLPAWQTPAVTLSLSNLAPGTTSSDRLVLASDTTPNTYDIYPSTPVVDGSLIDPAPTFFPLSADNYAMDAAKGDRAMLLQLHSISGGENVSPWSQACVRALDLSPLSLSSGQTTAIEGAMVEPPLKTFTFDLKLSQINALAAQVHPAAVPAGAGFEIVAVPGPLDQGFIGYLGELMYIDAADPTADMSGTFSYANPRASWSELAGPSVTFYVPMAVGATTPARVPARWSHFEPASTASGKSFSVTMAPPANLLVDGVDGHTNVALTSLTPLLTWDPPAIGDPNGYWITVSRLSASGKRTARRTVANLLTAKNELRIPPGIFQSGQRYAIAVGASHLTPPQDFRTRPFRDYTSADIADTLSGILTAP